VLPWKAVRDLITGSLQARFIELLDSALNGHAISTQPNLSGSRFPSATNACRTQAVNKAALRGKCLWTMLTLGPRIQDLGDKMDKLLKIKAKSKVPIKFHIRLEIGDGQKVPSQQVAAEVTQVLADVSNELQLRKLLSQEIADMRRRLSSTTAKRCWASCPTRLSSQEQKATPTWLLGTGG
jgi:hypothetical protein